MVVLLPSDYEFAGIGIHEILIFQSRIKSRIETLEESPKQTGPICAVIAELAQLDLALDHHISEEVKRQDADKTRRALHDAVTQSTYPLTKIIDAEKKMAEGPPFTQ